MSFKGSFLGATYGPTFKPSALIFTTYTNSHTLNPKAGAHMVPRIRFFPGATYNSTSNQGYGALPPGNVIQSKPNYHKGNTKEVSSLSGQHVDHTKGLPRRVHKDILVPLTNRTSSCIESGGVLDTNGLPSSACAVSMTYIASP